MYSIDYYSGFHILETLDDGEETIADRIKIHRFYVQSKHESNYHDYLTTIVDVTTQPRASICLVHDMGRCSDVFIELGLHLALNGFLVMACDLEGSGYSNGPRMCNLTIDKFQRQLATMLGQVPT